MSKTQAVSPARFAARLVDGMEPERLGDLIEAHEQQDVWAQLEGAVRAAYPKAAKLPADAEDRIKAALPDTLRRLFCAYSDHSGERIMIAQECGFLVGLEIGRRRAAGGAR